MIPRILEDRLLHALTTVPVVALLGPRQVGKTTLALQIANSRIDKKTTYLDLELDTDWAKLNEAELYLRNFDQHLLIIDEVQRKPDLFTVLRGLVDIRRRAGEKAGQFLLLGSASRSLLQQSSESLAGRIRYLELKPLSIREASLASGESFDLNTLWFRGGFPDSYLASNDDDSWDWRSDFIATYVERDIPLLGPKLPSEQMRRFWMMLGHLHGQQMNLSKLGTSLGVTHPTIRHYLDVLTDLYMVRQIAPWAGNSKKRLVKSPKIYLRDTGLLHRLVNIPDRETLLGHPIIGASWEGFIIENILAHLSDRWVFSYYRTQAQAEIDLILEGPGGQVWAIEIKRTLAPKAGKGFQLACEDVRATKRFFVYAGTERYPIATEVEAIGVMEILELIRALS